MKARLNPRRWQEEAAAAVARTQWSKDVKEAVRARYPTFPQKTLDTRVRGVERVLNLVAQLDVHPDDRLDEPPLDPAAAAPIDPFDAAQIVMREGDYRAIARKLFAGPLRAVGVMNGTLARPRFEQEDFIAVLLGVGPDED